MNETLQQIANILMLNVHTMENNSILEGKMGITLFLYQYAKYSGNKIYSEIADELLEDVFENIDKCNDISFDQGALGGAWGVRYLIRNKFVDGDPGEILSDVEGLLTTRYINDIQTKIPISTLGIYVASMINEEPEIDKHKDIIQLVLKKYELYFLCFSGNNKSIAYINSVLFLLSTLVTYTQYKEWVERIVYRIVLHISNIDNWKQMETCDLMCLHKLLSKFSKPSKEKESVMGCIENVCNSGSSKIEIRFLWQDFLYFPHKKTALNLNSINQYLDDNYTYISDGSPLSIYEGLACIGLTLIQNN